MKLLKFFQNHGLELLVLLLALCVLPLCLYFSFLGQLHTKVFSRGAGLLDLLPFFTIQPFFGYLLLTILGSFVLFLILYTRSFMKLTSTSEELEALKRKYHQSNIDRITAEEKTNSLQNRPNSPAGEKPFAKRTPSAQDHIPAEAPTKAEPPVRQQDFV